MHLLERRGNGQLPPIVLLHGLGSRGADYLPLLRRLHPHARRVVAPDLPGHGASGAPVGMELAACLEALGEALEAALDEPAVVYGNSLGGLAAIHFARTHPGRVRGLFLASPAGAPASPLEREALLATLRVETHRDALRFLEKVLHHRPGVFGHLVAWGLRRRYRTPALRALLASAQHARSLEPGDLARLQVPVYLLWGRSERLLPPSQLAFFRQHLPAAEVDESPGLGHSPQLDDVDELARRLLAFAGRC